jgi:hypothetical protein
MTITAWRRSKCSHYRVARFIELLNAEESQPREIIGGKFAAPRKLSSDFLIYRAPRLHTLPAPISARPDRYYCFPIINNNSSSTLQSPTLPAPTIRFIVSFSLHLHVNGNQLLCAECNSPRHHISCLGTTISLHYHRIVIFF